MAWTERYLNPTLVTGNDDGTTEADAWRTWATAASNVAAGHRVNVKNNSSSTSAVTLSTAGTATAPIWWRAYTSTIGDGGFVSVGHAVNISGSNQIYEGMTVTKNHTTNTPLVDVFSGGPQNVMLIRCSAVNTATSGNTEECFNMINNHVAIGCYASHANYAGYQVRAGASVYGCIAENCANEGFLITGLGSVTAAAYGCISFDNGAAGFNVTNIGARMQIVSGCTAYNNTGDGIDLTGVPAQAAFFLNNVLTHNGSYGIENSSGANTARVFRAGNVYANNTSGTENGFGDHPSWGDRDLGALAASAVYTSTAGDDFSLLPGIPGMDEGIPGVINPGIFRNDTGAMPTVGFRTPGAAQRAIVAAVGSSYARTIMGY